MAGMCCVCFKMCQIFNNDSLIDCVQFVSANLCIAIVVHHFDTHDTL